jgi:hypothetical protein
VFIALLPPSRLLLQAMRKRGLRRKGCQFHRHAANEDCYDNNESDGQTSWWIGISRDDFAIIIDNDSSDQNL